MRDPDQPGSVRVKACEVLLDRGHGKAPQFIRVSKLEEMSDEEHETYIVETQAVIDAYEKETGRTGGGEDDGTVH